MNQYLNIKSSGGQAMWSEKIMDGSNTRKSASKRPSIDSSSSTTAKKGKNNLHGIHSNDCRLEPFPSKLYQLLEDVHEAGNTHIISWSDDGRSFCIHKPKLFAQTYMVLFFNQSKYKSFQRQLNLYEFIRQPRGKILGVYSHPLFCRGDRELCKTIKRRSGRKRNESLANNNSNHSLLTRVVSSNDMLGDSFSSVSSNADSCMALTPPSVSSTPQNPSVSPNGTTANFNWNEADIPRSITSPRRVSPNQKLSAENINGNPFLRGTNLSNVSSEPSLQRLVSPRNLMLSNSIHGTNFFDAFPTAPSLDCPIPRVSNSSRGSDIDYTMNSRTGLQCTSSSQPLDFAVESLEQLLLGTADDDEGSIGTIDSICWDH